MSGSSCSRFRRQYTVGQGHRRQVARFLKHFRCRLVLFGYDDLTMDPMKQRREFATVEFQPPLAKSASDYAVLTLTQRHRSQEASATEIEMGVGIAMIVEKVTPGELSISAGQRMMVYVDDVAIGFIPRARNDDVTV